MILFIYGINFIEAYKITSILSLSLGLIFIQSVIQYFGVFNGFDKEIVRVQFITSIIKVLGFIIFIPIYKVQGVVFTILFAEIASFIMTIITYKKTIN